MSIANTDSVHKPNQPKISNTNNEIIAQITTQKLLEGNYIHVCLNRRLLLQALIDTGAGLTLIDYDFCKQNKIHMRPTQSNVRVITADNTKVECLALADITIEIGDFLFPFTAHVFKNIAVNLILGDDFLQSTEAVVDCGKRTASFKNHIFTVEIFKQNLPVARIAKAIVIPPNSEAITDCKIPFRRNEGNLILEPIGNLQHYKIALAKAIVRPRRGHVPCRLLNPTAVPVSLAAGTPVALVEKALVFSDENKSCENCNIQGASKAAQSTDTSKISEKEKIRQIESKGIRVPENNISHENKTKLIELLYANLDLFATNYSELPGTDLIELKVDTGDAKPVYRPPYRYSEAAKREIEKQCQELLDADIIEVTNSPWSCGVVLAAKKDGSLRMCVDFRPINRLLKPEFQPLPTLPQVLDTMANAKPTTFSLLDMKWGYHQIKINDEDSRDRLAFSTHHIHARYKRMPFGIRSAPALFQNLMSSILRDLTWKSVICYLDDILLYSGPDEHVDILAQVLDRFRRANLRLNGKKCNFFLPSIDYLGFTIDHYGVRIQEGKLDAIKNFARPDSQRKVRELIGFTNFFRKFIKGHSHIISNFRDILQHGAKFKWTECHEKAFQQLKEALSNPPVLAHPDNRRPFRLQVDSSAYATGWVLLQDDQYGRTHAISYGGRAIPKSAANWSVVDKEMFGILTAIKANHVWLAGQHFLVETDNVALSYLEKMKLSTGRLGRWAIQLMPYSFTIVYRKGKSNAPADALSRQEYTSNPAPTRQDLNSDDEETPLVVTAKTMPTNELKQVYTILPDQSYSECEDVDQQALVNTTLFEPELLDIATAQENCSECKIMRDYLIRGILPDSDQQARKTVIESEVFCMKNNILHHIYYPRTKRRDSVQLCYYQTVVPKAWRKEVLLNYHDNCGHMGFDKLYTTIRLKYWWWNQYTEVSEYVRTCHICQMSKRPIHFRKAPMGTMPVQDTLVRWSLDHTGPFPESNGFKYVLVAIECTSLWCELIPTRTTGVSEVVDALQDVIIPRFGIMQQLQTDRHATWSGKVYEALTKIFRADRIRTSSLHPQSNNRAEVFNSTLGKSLRALTQEQSQWSKFLPAIEMAYRATVTTSHGFSPFEVLFGKPMAVGFDSSVLKDFGTDPDVDTYLQRIIPKIQATRDAVMQNNTDAKERAKFYYDWNAQWPTYKVGDEVLLFDPTVKKGQSRKLKRQYVGPMTVEKVYDNYTYEIRDLRTGKLLKSHIHSNRLRPFYRRRQQLQPATTPRSATTPQTSNATTPSAAPT